MTKNASIKRTKWGSMEIVVGENDKVHTNLDFLRCICDPTLMHVIEGLRPGESVEVMVRVGALNVLETEGKGIAWRFGGR